MSRLPRWEGPGAARGSDFCLAVLVAGGGIGPAARAGPEGVPREKVLPRPGILELPDRKAVGERVDREGPEDTGDMLVCT